MKQAGKFSFVRIYEAGHEVPFYQPLVSLEMLERAIKGLDIATGKVEAGANYVTDGPPRSTYREGNLTVQYEVVPVNATYNTTTNMPNLPPENSTILARKKAKKRRNPVRPAPLRRWGFLSARLDPEL